MIRVMLIVFETLAIAGPRIKDISSLKGARQNQLMGYGLVAGLSGTGDKVNLDSGPGPVHQFLKGLGVDLKNRSLDARNTAEVTVQANVSPYATVGTRVDVVVSSLINAISLEGGTLLMTPLKGADGSVYAIAQGKIVVTRKKDARGVLQSQILATGEIYGGAILEKGITVEAKNLLTFNLHQADFTTAARMAIRINEELGGKYATATDAGRVEVITPYDYDGSNVELVALLENIEVELDRIAKVVVNERSGTVVMGEHVTLSPVAIAHGNLRLEVGQPQGQIVAKEKSIGLLSKGATVADVASGLNELGASPEELMHILWALKSSGSLMAELVVQ